MAFLDIRSVSKSYRNHRALLDVSMQVPKGGIMGLLGPNGAGKTTLIRMINRITAPDSGSIWLDGRELGPEHARRIGYLPEERGLYKKMKIGEQLLYLARLRGLESDQALQAAKHWMTRLEMQSWWNKKAEELSKGMQQKVQLVAALMHDPDLLILDEPFSGFDPVNARLLKNILLERRAAGTTLLISTHRMETVEDLCTDVVLIHQAGVVLAGPTQAVRRQHSGNQIEIHCVGETASPPPAPPAHTPVSHHHPKNPSTVWSLRLLLPIGQPSSRITINTAVSCILPNACPASRTSLSKQLALTIKPNLS
ncbi:MAG: ATP-binding cassette domain-containing protein [Sphingobacteriia bacterium]|nr:ATP-binding cassette domain-containing protein [Sphingobacteriia bacterium]